MAKRYSRKAYSRRGGRSRGSYGAGRRGARSGGNRATNLHITLHAPGVQALGAAPGTTGAPASINPAGGLIPRRAQF